MTAGISTIATKTAAGLAAAAIVTAGAVEVKHVQTKLPARAVAAAQAPPRVVSEPEVVASAQQPFTAPKPKVAPAPAPAVATAGPSRTKADELAKDPAAAPTDPVTGPAVAPTPGVVTDPAAGLAPVQEESDSTTLANGTAPPAQTGGVAAPIEPVTTTPIVINPQDPAVTTAPPGASTATPAAPAASTTSSAKAPAGEPDTTKDVAGSGGASASPSAMQAARARRGHIKVQMRAGKLHRIISSTIITGG
jgi:hypothetical protein